MLPCYICGDESPTKFCTVEQVRDANGMMRIRTRAYCPCHAYGKPNNPFIVREPVYELRG